MPSLKNLCSSSSRWRICGRANDVLCSWSELAATASMGVLSADEEREGEDFPDLDDDLLMLDGRVRGFLSLSPSWVVVLFEDCFPFISVIVAQLGGWSPVTIVEGDRVVLSSFTSSIMSFSLSWSISILNSRGEYIGPIRPEYDSSIEPCCGDDSKKSSLEKIVGVGWYCATYITMFIQSFEVSSKIPDYDDRICSEPALFEGKPWNSPFFLGEEGLSLSLANYQWRRKKTAIFRLDSTSLQTRSDQT